MKCCPSHQWPGYFRWSLRDLTAWWLKQVCPEMSPMDAEVSILSGESGTPRAAAGHRKPVGVFPHPSPRPLGDADKMGFAFRGDWEKLTENSMGFLGIDSARQKPSNI